MNLNKQLLQYYDFTRLVDHFILVAWSCSFVLADVRMVVWLCVCVRPHVCMMCVFACVCTFPLGIIMSENTCWRTTATLRGQRLESLLSLIHSLRHRGRLVTVREWRGEKPRQRLRQNVYVSTSWCVCVLPCLSASSTKHSIRQARVSWPGGTVTAVRVEMWGEENSRCAWSWCWRSSE